jgi:hypothetical protein
VSGHEAGEAGLLTIQVPVQKPSVAVPVIELFLEEGTFAPPR